MKTACRYRPTINSRCALPSITDILNKAILTKYANSVVIARDWLHYGVGNNVDRTTASAHAERTFVTGPVLVFIITTQLAMERFLYVEI